MDSREKYKKMTKEDLICELIQTKEKLSVSEEAFQYYTFITEGMSREIKQEMHARAVKIMENIKDRKKVASVPIMKEFNLKKKRGKTTQTNHENLEEELVKTKEMLGVLQGFVKHVAKHPTPQELTKFKILPELLEWMFAYSYIVENAREGMSLLKEIEANKNKKKGKS